MSAIVLNNERIRAEFDSRTGALIELLAKDTGWALQRRHELGLSFQMLLPLAQRRNNPIMGNEQEAPNIDRPDENSLVLTWRNLKSRHGGQHEITFRGCVRLTDDELVFTAELDNQSGHTIETVSWPCLGDLNRPEGSTKLDTGWLTYNMMLRSQMYPTFPNQKGYWGVDYPTQMAASWRSPFYLVENGTEGLYIGYHDHPTSRMLQYFFQLKPGYEFADSVYSGTAPQGDELAGEPARIEFQAIHYPFYHSGQSGPLSPVILAPYVGTWHKGVDHYKAWRQTWFSRPKVPAWAQKPHSWHLIHLNSPEDELRRQYKDLVPCGQAAAHHGVKAIQLTGWTVGGQDHGNPSHDTDPRLGTAKELADAIAAIQAMGVKVILFNKYTWADRSTDWYRRELVHYATKNPYGDAHYHTGYQYQTPTMLADINTRRFAPMCVCSEQWRKIAVQEFRKSLELGPAGILFDEGQHHGIHEDVTYCFDANHGHRVPEYVYSGDRHLEAAFVEEARARDPEFLFAGEGVTPHQFLTYAISYFRTDGLDSIMLSRYIDSQTGLMITITGHRNRNNINFALMHKLILSHEPRLSKGKLDDYPETMAYARLMDDLRLRYQDRLWDAEYRDVLGASVEADGQPHEKYTVFLTPQGKRAVVVCNFDVEKPKRLRLDLPGGPSGNLVTVSPESPEPAPCPNGQAELPPLSAIVFIEQ